MGLVGLLLTITVPAMTQFAAQNQLKATTRSLVGLLSLARSLAITSRAEHAVILDVSDERVSVKNLSSGELLEQAVRLPSALDVEIIVGGAPVESAELVFRPTGALAGRSATVTFRQQDREQTITVTSTTGAVTVK